MVQVDPHRVSYYEYFGRTFKIEWFERGERRGWLLDLDTGEFVPTNRPIMPVLGATSDSDISAFDEAGFIDETEQLRAYHLAGEGPIFEAYDRVDAIYRRMRTENRLFTDEETELITSIRRQTFAVWEGELARRAAGEPPSFPVRRKNV